MNLYEATLSNITQDNQTVSFTFGVHTLDIEFLWCASLTEQIDEYSRALTDRARSDSILKGAEIIKDYDWLDFYQDIPHTSTTQILEWLDQGYCPQSLQSLNTPDTKDMLATEIMKRCVEADDLEDMLDPLVNQFCWHITITDEDGEIVTGVLTEGGWYNEQSSKWRLTFRGKSEIGYSDLNGLTLYCEVYDE